MRGGRRREEGRARAHRRRRRGGGGRGGRRSPRYRSQRELRRPPTAREHAQRGTRERLRRAAATAAVPARSGERSDRFVGERRRAGAARRQRRGGHARAVQPHLRRAPDVRAARAARHAGPRGRRHRLRARVATARRRRASGAHKPRCRTPSRAWARGAPATCTLAFAATSDATPPAAATSARAPPHRRCISPSAAAHPAARASPRRPSPARRRRRRRGSGVARRHLTRRRRPTTPRRRERRGDEQAVAVARTRALRQHLAAKNGPSKRGAFHVAAALRPWPSADLGAARRLVLVAPHVAPVMKKRADVSRILCAPPAPARAPRGPTASRSTRSPPPCRRARRRRPSRAGRRRAAEVARSRCGEFVASALLKGHCVTAETLELLLHSDCYAHGKENANDNARLVWRSAAQEAERDAWRCMASNSSAHAWRPPPQATTSLELHASLGGLSCQDHTQAPRDLPPSTSSTAARAALIAPWAAMVAAPPFPATRLRRGDGCDVKGAAPARRRPTLTTPRDVSRSAARARCLVKLSAVAGGRGGIDLATYAILPRTCRRGSSIRARRSLWAGALLFAERTCFGCRIRRSLPSCIASRAPLDASAPPQRPPYARGFFFAQGARTRRREAASCASGDRRTLLRARFESRRRSRATSVSNNRHAGPSANSVRMRVGATNCRIAATQPAAAGSGAQREVGAPVPPAVRRRLSMKGSAEDVCKPSASPRRARLPAPRPGAWRAALDAQACSNVRQSSCARSPKPDVSYR